MGTLGSVDSSEEISLIILMIDNYNITVIQVMDIMQQGPSSCVTVTVTYENLQGEVRNGYLRAKEDEKEDYFSTHPQVKYCNNLI